MEDEAVVAAGGRFLHDLARRGRSCQSGTVTRYGLRTLPVDVSAVANVHDRDPMVWIIDFVNHAV